MFNEALKLRGMEAGDREDLYHWRNHPIVRKNSFNTAPLSWEEHQEWFERKIRSAETVIYIAYVRDHKIGVIRFDNKSDGVRVSVMLNPQFIGQGLGSRLIGLGIKRYVREQGSGKTVIAEIKESNIASIKAFQKAGFKKKHLSYILET